VPPAHVPLPVELLAAVFQPEVKAVRVPVLPPLFTEVFMLVKPEASVGAVLLADTKAVTNSKSPACSPAQAAVLVLAAELAQTKLSAEALARRINKPSGPRVISMMLRIVKAFL